MAHAISSVFIPTPALRAVPAMRASGVARAAAGAPHRLTARVALAGRSVQYTVRTRARAAPRAMGMSVRAEDGEEEMMIEEEAMEKMEKSISVLQENLSTVRTGRANPSVLDRVEVEYYGAPCTLQSLANVNTPDAQTLLIQPFDKTAIGDIERAIMKSDLGLTPNNDGNVIRLAVPPLTQERRAELAKLCSKLGEDAKVAVRNVRRDATKDLQKLEKAGSSKDTIADYCDTVDKMTKEYIEKIDKAVAAKEKDVMSV